MNTDSRHWQFQQAESNLTQLLKEADAGGPQYIAVNGKDAAVVLSIRDYERLKYRSTSLSAMLAAPLLDDDEVADLFERTADSGRSISLSCCNETRQFSWGV